MKRIYILLTIFTLCGIYSCSEEKLTPAEPYRDNFAPDASATDEESRLRREFFDANGFHILFNDTLCYEYAGMDVEGDPVYRIETVDPAWSLTGYDANTTYNLALCEGIEKKRRNAEFMAEVGKVMEKVNLPKPRAVLVVDEINTMVYDSYWDEYTFTAYNFLNTLRCPIIALPEITGAEKDVYNLVANLATSGLMANYSDDLEEFDALGYDDYDYDMHDSDKYYYLPDECYGTGDDYIEEFYYIGFLVNTNDDKTCTRAEDVASYVSLLLRMSKDEVYDTFRDYDLVLQKYEAISKLAQKAGIKF